MLTYEDLTRALTQYAASERNTLELVHAPAFDLPLFGVSAGDDPLYAFLREDIGEVYETPAMWLPDVDPAHIRVVSWVLPQTQRTREAMRAQSDAPTREWALVRTFGESFNRELGTYAQTFLKDAGYSAIAPLSSERFHWGRSEKYGYASNWSERHAAYVSGMGTFGLCDGLISVRGKAVRYGSVIVAADYPVTPRPYTRYNEYCLHDRGCRACIDRCPAGAIGEQGHNKDMCAAYQGAHVGEWKSRFGFEGTYGCGLCQTGVPCEYEIPHKI